MGEFSSIKFVVIVVQSKSHVWLFAPHGLQHTRPPCPLPSPEISPSSCPLSRWCCLTISYSAVIFSFCLQSFPASGSFPMSLLFASGGQSVVASALTSVLPMNIQGWFHLGLTGLSSLLSRNSEESSPAPYFKSINSQCALFFMVQFSHLYMTTGKTIALTRQTFVGKVLSLLFNTLSRFVIAFLPRNKRLLISWLQSPSSVILDLKKRKSVTASTSSPSLCHEWWDWMPWS